MHRHIAVALIVCALLIRSLGVQARTPQALEPDRIHALIIGVLQFRDQGLRPYPRAGRKDAELYQLLLQRQVPRQNISLFLDSSATRSKVLPALQKLAAAAGEKDTLIIYYAGHGIRTPDGSTFFALFDTDSRKPQQTALSLAHTGNVLSRHFKGKRLLLFADCCHSGSLSRVARIFSTRPTQALALTSADACNNSTGNWTFTMTLLDCLRGSYLADHNKDRWISLAELRAETAAAMKHVERQLYGYANYGVPLNFRLARRQKKIPGLIRSRPSFPRGSYVAVRFGNKWRPGRVLFVRKSGYKVRLYAYNSYQELKVKRRRLKAISFRSWKQGQLVRVRWSKHWFPARIRRVRNHFHLISYLGWPRFWDEWVMGNRIRPLKDKQAQGKEPVLVEWKGRWYPACILKSGRQGKFRIHYLGYSKAWDEWVPRSRIRFPRQKGKNSILVEWKGRWYPARLLKTKGSKALIKFENSSGREIWVGTNRIRQKK